MRGCLAPHSQLRGAIIPTPRQQGVDGREASTGTPCWSWARLLKRVFALDMATCPVLPTWLAPDHCRHHPGGGDHADPPSSEACGRPAPDRSCPFSPRNFRLGRLSHTSRVVSWATCAQRRCVSHASERVQSRLKSSPPAFQKPPVPRLPPVAPLSSPPLPHPAPPVQAALRLALGRAGGAAATRWARGQSCGRGVAAGRWCWGACCRGGSAKRPFVFPIRSSTNGGRPHEPGGILRTRRPGGEQFFETP